MAEYDQPVKNTLLSVGGVVIAASYIKLCIAINDASNLTGHLDSLNEPDKVLYFTVNAAFALGAVMGLLISGAGLKNLMQKHQPR